MKIVNDSEQFVVKFGGVEYTIPHGEFEVVNEKLGNHILFSSNKWGKKVDAVPNTTIDQIKSIDKKEVYNPSITKEREEVVAPAFGGATTETLPKKMGRPKKNVEQTA